jgi:hypothetical protein
LASSAFLPRLQFRPVIESREQLTPGHTIQESGDRQAIAVLIGPHRRLRMGRLEAIEGARVTPEVAPMHLRDLNGSSGQEPDGGPGRVLYGEPRVQRVQAATLT